MGPIPEERIRALAESGAAALARWAELGFGGQRRVALDLAGQFLANHLVGVAQWATEVSFRALRQSRTLQQIFVDLDLEMGSSPSREQKRDPDRPRVSDLLGLEKNIVILGDPGAGKSTSLQRLAHGILLQEDQGGTKPRIPLLVLLKDLHGKKSLAESILESLGISLHLDEKIDRRSREKTSLLALIKLLGLLDAVLMLDGLDELHPEVRQRVTDEIRQLLRFSAGYRIFITWRTADATRLENTAVYTIEPLSDVQIETFAQNWLGEERAKDLLRRIRDTPYGGSEVLPLTLAHLCAIYERTGTVPKQPKTIYVMIVRLLLNEWDWDRQVQRASAFSDFHVDRKEEFLRALAFELTARLLRRSFDFIQIDRAYRAICGDFRLSTSECRRVLQEIEAHTGLILRSSFDKFDFAHKSLQEYLAAEYILRLPNFPGDLVSKAPYEMALVVSLSSDPTEHFLRIVESAVKSREGVSANNFTVTFLHRLFLEKVDFKPSLRFGQGITELFAATFYPLAGQAQLGLHLAISSVAVREFFRLAGVRQSVLQALKRAEVGPRSGEIYRVRWREMPESFTTSDPGVWIDVDKGFLEMAGFTIQGA